MILSVCWKEQEVLGRTSLPICGLRWVKTAILGRGSNAIFPLSPYMWSPVVGVVLERVFLLGVSVFLISIYPLWQNAEIHAMSFPHILAHFFSLTLFQEQPI